MAIKKGTLVTVKTEALTGEVALANDARWSPYVSKTPGEILEVRGDYALIKFGAVPTPPAWLPVAALEEKIV